MSNTTGHCALLVIDVQQALFEKATPVFRAEALLATINALVSAAHLAGARVVWVQHGDKRALAPGTPGWQLHASLQPLESDLRLDKQHPNAYEDTALDGLLKRFGVTDVVVCGLVTHGCVRATCLGALKLGYAVTLAADAHSSYNKEAAGLIDEWNGALAAQGIAVLPAARIPFAPLPSAVSARTVS